MGSTLNLKGGVSNPKSVTEDITQAGHGFSIGDAVRYDLGEAKWVKAKADNAENAEVAGIISSVPTSNSFQITYSGYIFISSLSSNTSPVLFLDSVVAGGLTASPPSAVGMVIKPVVTKVSNSGGYAVMNYLGTQIGGSSTVSIEEIQPVGSIIPFGGSVVPETWEECNGAYLPVVDYPELYSKLLYTTGAKVPVHGYRAVVTLTSPIEDASIISYTVDGINYIGNVITISGNTITVEFRPQYLSVPTGNPPYSYFQYPNIAFDPSINSIITIDTEDYQFSSARIESFRIPDLGGRTVVGSVPVFSPAEYESPDDPAFISGRYRDDYKFAAFGGQEGIPTRAGFIQATSGGTIRYTSASTSQLGTIQNVPPYLAVRYIIKTKPYARAAIVEGVEVPYDRWLITDIRDGSINPGGAGTPLVFRTNTTGGGTERMRLTNDGNLGVGSSSPVAKLDVRGTVSVSNSGAFPTATSTLQNNRVLVGGVQPELLLWNDGSSTTAGGNSRLCIGVKSPNNTNAVSGAFIRAGNSSTTNGNGFMSIGITDSTNTEVERMRITSAGRIGIGTDDPQAAVHVEDGQLLLNGSSASLSIPLGKATSAVTVSGDAPNTLATKSYVDSVVNILPSSIEVLSLTAIQTTQFRDNRQTLRLDPHVPSGANFVVLTIHSRSEGNAVYDVLMGSSTTIDSGHRVAYNSATGTQDNVAFSNQVILPIARVGAERRVYWNTKFDGQSMPSSAFLRVDVNGYIG